MLLVREMANKTIAARISKPLYDELEQLAERQKVVKSRIIEDAVCSLLARESANKQAQTPSLRESKHVETPRLYDEKEEKPEEKEPEEVEAEEIPITKPNERPAKPKDDWKKALGALAIFAFLAIAIFFAIRFFGRKKEEEKREEKPTLPYKLVQ